MNKKIIIINQKIYIVKKPLYASILSSKGSTKKLSTIKNKIKIKKRKRGF